MGYNALFNLPVSSEPVKRKNFYAISVNRPCDNPDAN